VDKASRGGLQIGCGFGVAMLIYSLVAIPSGPMAIITGVVVLGAIGVLAAAISGFSGGVEPPMDRQSEESREPIGGRVVVVVKADNSDS